MLLQHFLLLVHAEVSDFLEILHVFHLFCRRACFAPTEFEVLIREPHADEKKGRYD
jgi:hypothetical protein